ncbi:MAG: hypothetical protein AB1762_19320 [Gemmatimonadota bacterium]
MPSKSLVLAAVIVAVAGCKSSLIGFGPTPTEAVRNAGDGLMAHALRFDDVVRDTKSATARAQMSRYALTPSRIFNDTTVWTAMNERDSSRLITIDGAYDALRGGYTFRANPVARVPAALGESRHLIRLDMQPDGAYAWGTSVDQAIGKLPASFAGRALTALLASAEAHSARNLASESRAAYPRTARALGRLFSLDSAHSESSEDGSATTSLAIRWHAARLSAGMPHFAGFVAKYIEPATYAIALSDRKGQTYMQIRGDKGVLFVRWRSRDGHLLPLDGRANSPMPDTLRIRMDFNTKYKMFRVGFSEMLGDFIIQRSSSSIGWMMHFRDEPEWNLPLFTETLIRSPLRRPFQGRGSELYLGVHEGGAQTLLVRRTRTEVKESAILRWLNGLGATAMGDYQGKAEAEQNRFLSDAFTALRVDSEDLMR